MRKSGILMPIAGLPGKYGIGTLGKSAFDFIDFLKASKQTVWQILPVSPTGFGDSPYQSCSAFAGNPYFIDLDLLKKEGLLKKGEYESLDYGKRENAVDYAALYQNRYLVLHKAFERFSKWYPDDYYHFCYEQGWWLEDYALYMTAKGLNGGKNYLDWPEEMRSHSKQAIDALYSEHEKEVHFWKFCQYEFSRQWTALKQYAAKQGIRIMGDIPIYVAADSADVWASPELFLLDENGTPTDVAGCPPDFFSDDGQLWGNPLYRWDYHEKTDFAWWVRRIRYALELYDILRIDHFRGFDTYYAIPYGETTARNGEWRTGPGMKLFCAVKKALGEQLPIVAEDLGELFPSVYELLRETGFPGMKVLEFAFGSGPDNEFLPHNYTEHCIVYTGTHDNTTAADWSKTASVAEKKHAAAYLGLNKEEGWAAGLVRGAMASCAKLCIIPLADHLALGRQARINTPSTLGGTNWLWRASKADLCAANAKKIAAVTERFGRA